MPKHINYKKPVENLQSLGLINTLDLDVEKMKEELKIKKKFLNENLVTLDNASDRYMEDTQQLQQNILSRINRLFDEYIYRQFNKNKKCKKEDGDSVKLKLKYISTIHKVKEKMTENPFNEIAVILTADISENVKKKPQNYRV